MNDCEATIRPALSDVLGEFYIEADENSCRVVTPFRHHNDDLIRIWIRSVEEDYFEIRDYGETHSMLEIYGVSPDTDSRRPRLKKIRKQFELNAALDGEFMLRCQEDVLGERILDMIQAIQAASYFIYTHTTQQPSRFKTKVGKFFEDTGYDFGSNFEVQGPDQTRVFDYSINHREPTVLIDTIHSNQEYTLRREADSVYVNWTQLKDSNYKHGVIIDDQNGIEDDEILSAIHDNLDYYFNWSTKTEITEKIPVSHPP